MCFEWYWARFAPLMNSACRLASQAARPTFFVEMAAVLLEASDREAAVHADIAAC